MADLPTKDETIGRALMAAGFGSWNEIKAAVDALTIPDLLALLRERGVVVTSARSNDGRPYP